MHKVKAIILGLLFLGTLAFVPNAKAQSNNYKQTNLTSDTEGLANFRSADLINPWGVASAPGNLFLVADNHSGKATLHNSTGNLRSTFTIPAPAGSSNPSRPTGVVANASGGFKVGGVSSQFLFATEDGTISGWHQGMPSAMLAVDNSKIGTVYKGLALVTQSNGAQVLLATNFSAGTVEAFDSDFTPMAMQGAFKDPTLPEGFVPFGIHVIGANQVVVTFAQHGLLNGDVLKATGAGFVSLFDADGNFVNHIASQETLNAPWGAAIAPPGFGQFDGALLIGNVGDGTINAFDGKSLSFLGQLKNSGDTVLINPSLRELVFASEGQTGGGKTLFITAGLTNQMHGLFANITPNTTTNPSFSLSASPGTLTVTRGTSGAVTITAAALNGFSGTINGFACTGMPLYSSCAFSKTSLAPSGSTTDSLTLTVQTNTPNPGPGPYGVITGMGTLLPLSSLSMFGLVMAETRRRKKAARRTWWRWLGYAGGIALLCGTLLSVYGCGGYGSGSHPTPTGSSTVTVTGTSGTEMESTTFSLTVQ